MNKKIRFGGILLHPTSLPANHGIGDFGEEAFNFVDYLHSCSIGLWQILPLGPVGYGNSPYAVRSAFAGNELLISLELLADEDLLEITDILEKPPLKKNFVDYNSVANFKIPLLKKAALNFIERNELQEFEDFCSKELYWLDDYALFQALCDHFNDTRWFKVWPKELAKRESSALSHWNKEKEKEILIWKVCQFFFYQQWNALKEYANKKQIAIVGDIPIFVAHDSVDAWANSAILKLKEDGSLKVSSGVPPDAFSPTGQLWGNPLYDWDVMEKNGFKWWIERLKHQFEQTDMVRIDHFRGFEAYWEVPAKEKTAENGKWVKAKGEELFEKLHTVFETLPVIAEDLGVITPEVDALREKNNFPGMKIAHFSFDIAKDGLINEHNAYLPHNYEHLCVAYTGTHDNDTSVGWYNSLPANYKDIVRRYLSCSDADVPYQLMRSVMASCAQFAIIPMQDVLLLDGSARMNLPGSCGEPNWCWRLEKEQLNKEAVERLSELTRNFARQSKLEDLKLLFKR